MLTIWKFPLEAQDLQKVKIPKIAKVLTVQVQHGQPCLCAMVDPEQPCVELSVRIYGTGRTIPEDDMADFNYVGTVQMAMGTMVFHVFVEK